MNFKHIILYEIKSQLKSRIFYAFIAVVLLALLTNYSTDITRLDPLEPDEYYGFTSTTEEKDVLYRGYELLYITYIDKQVIRYIPFGTYKKLSENQLGYLEEFLEKMAPNKKPLEATKDDFKINTDTMFEFLEKFDHDVGGKTYFADKEYFYSRLMTYEEALEKRSKIRTQDTFTRSYARLFSDYNGISAAFFVGFIAVFSIYRDLRTGERELHYTSNTSALTYISGKFIGVLISIMGVFLLFALIETIIFVISALKNGETINLFAFIWTTIIWITPTVMFSIAFPFLIYVAFDRFSLALMSQLIISVYMLTSTKLHGDYGFSRLIIRFNALTPYEEFAPFASDILVNRGLYVLFSILILALTGHIWDSKKKHALKSV